MYRIKHTKFRLTSTFIYLLRSADIAMCELFTATEMLLREENSLHFKVLQLRWFNIFPLKRLNTSRLPVLTIRVYNSGLEGVLGSGGSDAEAIHGGVSSG